ncbi:MAG: hypothetical protein Q7V53_02815 [Caldisericota bacterium]|nr:hypothetical protein [Caldisericota bacterium]
MQVRRTALKSAQLGKGAASLLVTLALAVAALLIVWGNSPAESQDLQAVISLASSNPESKASLAASLKETPNPSRADLHRMRNRVNEILVNGMAKEVTGDITLATPAEHKATGGYHEADQVAALESKTWGEMNTGERAEYLLSKLPFVGVLLVLVAMGLTLVRKGMNPS